MLVTVGMDEDTPGTVGVAPCELLLKGVVVVVLVGDSDGVGVGAVVDTVEPEVTEGGDWLVVVAVGVGMVVIVVDCWVVVVGTVVPVVTEDAVGVELGPASQGISCHSQQFTLIS